ncbi:MAG: cell wall-binding repeat-containing protein [Anaerosomatales bacterium]|nr:cell wall-binding repeat-containing protein [Anaerosomatales bacterium]
MSARTSAALSRRRLLALLSIVAMLASTVAQWPAAAASPPLALGDKPPAVEKAATAGLDDTLADVARAYRDRGRDEALRRARDRMLDVEGDAVEVTVECVNGRSDGVVSALRSAGARVTGRYADLVRALVPVALLEQVAASSAVLRVRRPMAPRIAEKAEAPSNDSGGLARKRVKLTKPRDAATAARAATPPQTTRPAPQTTLFSHGFESWPGPWSVWSPSGTPTWGRTTYRKSEGSYSAYCAQSTRPAPGPYVNVMESWIWTGPIDISSATSAFLKFDLWLKSESGYDYLWIAFSTDDYSYDGFGVSGDSSGWQSIEVDLGDVLGNGSLSYLGTKTLYVAFIFESDSSVTYEGAYVDNVVLDTESSSGGVVTSEGVAETGADQLHAAGIDGTGVKVGIIDGGFSGYSTLLGSELPTSVVTWGGSSLGPEGNGSEVHGTAVAETVHDMAPGATLYLAQVNDEIDLGNAAAWMVAQGVDVINMSLAWFGDGPGNGTGIVNGIVSNTVSNGVFWANSAGNYRENHWSGNFVDTNANGWLEWATGVEVQWFTANAGEPIVAYLIWDDSWTNASQDYDFALLYWTGSSWSILDASTETQDGSAGCRPVEQIGLYAPSSGTYAWAVQKYAATRTNVDFDLIDPYRYLNYAVYARSITIPADNPSSGFMAAGAIGRAPSYAQEPYSSEGPTRDGRLTPEAALPSATTNSVYGTFYGTSSSSPHLAGAAALVVDQYPTYTPSQVESWLRSHCVDLGTSGADNQYGYGRVWLPGSTPPTNRAPVANTDTYSTTAGQTLTVAAPGVLANDTDPDGDPLTAQLVTTAAHGTLSLNPNGSFSYTPAAGYTGTDSFSYRASDGALLSGTASVLITVNAAGGGGRLAMTPAELDFGNVAVGQTSQKTVTIQNTGTGPMTVSGVTLDGWAAGEYRIATDNATGRTIPAGGSATVVVEFRPTTAASGSPSFTTISGETWAAIPLTSNLLWVLRNYQNNGGSGAVSFAATAGSYGSTVSTQVCGGDRYLFLAQVPVWYNSAASFRVTHQLPGYADGVTVYQYSVAGGPAFALVRHYDCSVRVACDASNASSVRTGVYGVGTSGGPAVTEIAGTDRYDTAVKISQKAFPSGADAVVIATGANWPDALGGSALAGLVGGPILLTEKDRLTPVTENEIKRLGAEYAFVLGGTGAVGTAVENKLKQLLDPNPYDDDQRVLRIGGANRYETAWLVALLVTYPDFNPGWDGTAFVATGKDFPDALAAAPIAAKMTYPIFLADPAGIGDTALVMDELGVRKAVILGGTGAVPVATKTTLERLFGASNVSRLEGLNRYHTATVISQWGVLQKGMRWNGLAIATGERFPDALAGGVMQGREGSVMLLTKTASLSPETQTKLVEQKGSISSIKFLGGLGALSQTTRDQILAALR